MKILILTLIIGISVSLKPTEICKNSQQVCKGTYDSSNTYSNDCKQVKCHGHHPFKCNNFYCTNHAKSCIDFYNLNRQSISKFRIPHRSNSHAVLAKLMKTCQSKEYKSNKKDVCLNGYKFNLVMKSIDYSRSQPKLIIKKIVCLFKGKHNFPLRIPVLYNQY